MENRETIARTFARSRAGIGNGGEGDPSSDRLRLQRTAIGSGARRSPEKLREMIVSAIKIVNQIVAHAPIRGTRTTPRRPIRAPIALMYSNVSGSSVYVLTLQIVAAAP